MLHPLFCYGTLEAPDVFRKVTGTLPPSASAELAGYACYHITGASYPAIIKQPDARTTGTLYTHITPQLLKRIDQYESDMYTRELVQVCTGEASTVAAWTYVLAGRYRRRLTKQRWNRERFLHEMAHTWLKSL